jgi:hypothetical protein
MQDLLKLERLCSDLPVQIDRSPNDLAREVVHVIAADVIAHTPVDTTEHASNWQPGVGAAPNFGLPPIYPGEQGSTAPQSRREALAHVDRGLKDKDPGVPFYLTNVAPAIEDLNNGTSKQEPAGMVQRAVRKGELHAARSALEIIK